MTDFRRLNPILAILVAVTLAACGGGGGGTATTAPTGAAATSGPTEATTTDAAATDAPATAAPATAAPAGGGGVADVCGLVTADELASILDVSSVVLTVFEGPPDTCDIQSGDGALLAATVLTVSVDAITFGFIKTGSGVQDVPGLGDEAIYLPDSLLLVVRKGESMVSIAVFDDGRSESERLELMKQIGAIAAGRM